jgi:transposase
MDVLWLKSQGLPHKEICLLTGISSTTLRKYLRMFQAGGVEKLREMNFYAPASELEQHRHLLEAYFREHPPATINEAMAKIQELTGVKRSPSAVGRFLGSLGMSPRKVGAIPLKADTEEQESFRVNKLEPRLEEAKQGKRAIFLSMPRTSYSDPFLVFCGHLHASL